MFTLSLNTADRKIPHLLSFWMNPGHAKHFNYMDSPLMMVFQSASWAYICTKMGMRLPSIGQNTCVQKQTGNTVSSVNTSVHQWNTAELYISLPMTIRDYLTYL